MRNIKKFILLVFVILLTGCTNYDMSMKIDKDKSMLFSITILSDNQNEISNGIIILKEKYEKYGFVVSEYNQGNGYGVVMTKKFDDIDDISFGKRSDEFDLLYFYNNDYDSNIEKNMFNVDKEFYTNRYAANFIVDLSGYANLSASSITYSVYLPNGSVNNNASIVSDDGKTLTWNITSYGKNDIDFVFELSSYDNVYYAIAIIIAIALLFLIIRNLFGKNDETNNNDSVKYSNYGVNNQNKNYSNYGMNNQNKNYSNYGMNNQNKNYNQNNSYNKQVGVNKTNEVSDTDGVLKEMERLTKKTMGNAPVGNVNEPVKNSDKKFGLFGKKKEGVNTNVMESNNSVNDINVNTSILNVPVIPKSENNELNINRSNNDMDIFEIPVDLNASNNNTQLDDEDKVKGAIIKVNNQDVVTDIKNRNDEM